MRLHFLAKHSFKTRVTLSTMVIFLASLWGLSFYASREFQNNMETLASAQQFSAASLLAGEVDRAMVDRLRLLDHVANNVPPVLLAYPKGMQAQLDNLLVLKDLFNGGVLVLNVEGSVIAELAASTGQKSSGRMDWASVTATLQQGRATVGQAFMDEARHAPMFGMSIPLRDEAGRVIGALTGLTDLSRPNFLRIVSDNHYGKTGGYLLVDPVQRRIITATDPRRIMEQLPGPGINAAVERFIRGFEGSLVLVNPHGIEILASDKAVPTTGWIVAAVLPTDEAFAPIRATQQRMLFTTVLLTLLAGGLTWWLLRRQLAPVFDTVKALSTHQQSDAVPQPLPLNAPGEIGELIRAFNTLLARLAEGNRALKHQQDKVQKSYTALQNVLNTTLDGYWRCNSQGYLQEVNPAYCALSGYTQQELVGKHITELDTAESSPATSVRLMQLRERGSDRFETRHRRKDGSWWDVEVSATLDLAGEGDAFAFLRDITRRKQADLKLQLAASVFRHAFEGIIITNVQGTILDVNQAFCRITGYSREEALGQNPRMLKSERQDPVFYAELWHDLTTLGHWSGEIWNRRKNGEVYAELLNISAVHDEAGEVHQYVALFSDISARKAIEDRVRQLAFFDALTELPNRRLLADRLNQAMLLNQRNGHYGALMFLDLDNFKPLNDQHGHATGDLLLIEVARRLKACVRQVDTVARVGGDEYVVMLSELDTETASSQQQALALAEKVRQSLAEPYLLPVKHAGRADTLVEHHCTASIGVTLFAPNETSQDNILKQADAAMYRAKDAGRNRVEFDPGT